MSARSYTANDAIEHRPMPHSGESSRMPPSQIAPFERFASSAARLSIGAHPRGASRDRGSNSRGFPIRPSTMRAMMLSMSRSEAWSKASRCS